MSAIDDIVLNVVLSGNDNVAAAFDRMRAAGERLFNGLDKAAGSSISSFTALGTAIAGVAAATTIAGVGLFAFTKSMSDVVNTVQELAEATGETTEEITGLKAAFAAGGAGPGEMEQAFRRLAITVANSWSQIKKDTRESADNLKGASLGVTEALVKQAEARRDLANASRDQAHLEQDNALSVQSASLHLAELLGRDVSQQRARLELGQARANLAKAEEKQQDDIANAAINKQKAVDAAEKSDLELSQARKRQQDIQRNDVTNVINAVKQVAQGNKAALQDIDDSAENIVKGVIGASGDAGKALGALRGDLTDLSSPAPELKATLEVLSKTLANIENSTLRTSVAARFFGRAVSQDVINVVSDPSKLKEFQDRIDQLGLSISKQDTETFKKFRESLFGLQNDIELIASKMAAAFGPGFTTILKAIDDALINNRQKFIDFAEAIASRAVPVVESFIRILTGVPDKVKDEWLIRYIDKIREFGETVGTVASAVTTVIQKVAEIAGGIGDVINSVFGTKLNAFDVLLGAWLLKITGAFSLIGTAAVTAAEVIGTAFAAAGIALGPIAIGLIAIITGLVAAYNIAKAIGDLTKDDKGLTLQQRNDKKGIGTFTDVRRRQAREDRERQGLPPLSVDSADSDEKVNALNRLQRSQEAIGEKMITDQQKQLNQQNEDWAKSINEKIADLNRLAEAAKKSVSGESTANKPNISSPTGGFKNPFLPQPQGGRVGSDFHGIAPDSFGNFAEEILKKFGVSRAIINGVSVGSGEGITGDTIQLARGNTIFGSAGQVTQGPPSKRSAEDLFNELGGLPGGIKDATKQGAREGVAEGLREAQRARALGGLPTSEDVPNPSGFRGGRELQAPTGEPSQGPRPFQGNGRELQAPIPSEELPSDALISSLKELPIVTDDVSTAFGQLASVLEDAADRISTAASNAAERLASTGGGGGGGSEGTITAATGGLIGGKLHTSGGTLIEAERDEFIHKRAATSFWGLDFMHAINNLDLKGVFGRLPRFGSGGPVSFANIMPRFNGGGPVVAAPGVGGLPLLGHVDLSTNWGGGRVIVDSGGFDALSRMATTKRLTSTFKKKPGFVS